MPTKRHPTPNRPPCKAAAPPANPRPDPLALPAWQRARVQHLEWACRQISERNERGEPLTAAAAAVAITLRRRCPNAKAIRVPTTPASLIRFFYLWRSGGATALQQRFGTSLPAVPEATAIAFVNWAIGRQRKQGALLWHEFKAQMPRRARRDHSAGRVAFWFANLRQRLAELEARP